MEVIGDAGVLARHQELPESSFSYLESLISHRGTLQIAT